MIVLPPLTITDTIFTSSNVTEADRPEWLIGTSYVATNEVMVTSVTEANIHRLYEALQATTGDQPWTDDGSNWLDEGPTNRWAMFDTVNGTQTTNADEIDVTLAPGQVVDGLAALNLSGATLQVIVDDPTDGVVYDETVSLIADNGINDWHAYYFSPIERITDVVLTDLPSYKDATVQVILTETGETVAFGVLVIGQQVRIGVTNYGASIGIRDYSRKEVDSFGNFQITERAFSKRAEYPVTVNTNRTAFVQNYLASIRTSPVVWIGNGDFGATIVYGYYRDFDVVLGSFQISECNISVEGLT